MRQGSICWRAILYYICSVNGVWDYSIGEHVPGKHAILNPCITRIFVWPQRSQTNLGIEHFKTSIRSPKKDHEDQCQDPNDVQDERKF